MIAWSELAVARAPGGVGLKLMRRGDELSITLGANELMNSRLGGSERALATLACARLEPRANPRVLIGGLGMGFTLRAALEALGPASRVDVAELVPEVVAWARGPMSDLFAGCLDDPRVTLVTADVAEPIAAAQGAYDAVLLDVDNGPEGLVSPSNDGLYGPAGLAAARRALRPDGVLAVWSAAPSARFVRALEQAGFGVEEVRVRARSSGGARHVVWIAQAPCARPPPVSRGAPVVLGSTRTGDLTIMAKGQKRPNKEARKPKAEKAKPAPVGRDFLSPPGKDK